MFELTQTEFERLRSQFVTSNIGRGGARYRPYAFTEQGIAMLSGVLKTTSEIYLYFTVFKLLEKYFAALIINSFGWLTSSFFLMKSSLIRTS